MSLEETQQLFHDLKESGAKANVEAEQLLDAVVADNVRLRNRGVSIWDASGHSADAGLVQELETELQVWKAGRKADESELKNLRKEHNKTKGLLVSDP